MALNARQEAFVNEYLKCRNAAEAARRAGYSARSARQQGQRLLTNDDILAEIQARTQEKAMEADEALSRLADIARGSMEDFVSFTHEPYPAFTLDLAKARRRGVLHLIHELSYDSNGNPKLKLYDAKDAAKAILDYLTHGPTGSKDDPLHHSIQYIREVRPDSPPEQDE